MATTDTKKVRVRHDTPIRLHVKSGIKMFGDYDHDTEARYLDAALAVEAVKHGNISGYEGTAARYEISWKILDESFILKEGELCTCNDCRGGKYEK